MVPWAYTSAHCLICCERRCSISLRNHIDPPVFWGSLLCILAIIALGVVSGDGGLLEASNHWKNHFLGSFSWAFIGSFLWIFVLMVKILVQYSDYKIGGPQAQPEFTKTTWIAMLFSAGLGTGLLYAGALDPMSHFINADLMVGFNTDPEKMVRSMEITYLHWGLPAWFVYGATGLIFAVIGFQEKGQFQFSALVPPRLTWLRHGVNISAILAIILGVITTFAIAATQINEGMNRLFPFFETSPLNANLIIGVITLMATVSVLSGLKKGIRLLSQLNMTLVGLLFFYMLAHSQINGVLSLFIETSGRHLSHFFEDLTFSAALKRDKGWVQDWTLMYWAWWGAWAPFVGLFIARISRGRTIKEFIVGVALAPTLITWLWFTLFGYMSFNAQSAGLIDYHQLIKESPSQGLFALLDLTSLPYLSSLLAIVCIIIFYVTSSDSGSYVVDMIASGGRQNPSPYLKVFWSFTEGALAMILFAFGGVELIQNFVILLSLPTILYVAFGLFKMDGKLRELYDKI